jgi:cysteinyl-tRNA synthetase, unknown class
VTNRGTWILIAVVVVTAGFCASKAKVNGTTKRQAAPSLGITSWVYQLHGYDHGRLDALARAPQQLAVIDLARDAGTKYFTNDEVTSLRRSGKIVLAYFEIGSIEDFRPEYPVLRKTAPDLIEGRWKEWPNESFVRYWDERWWDLAIRPRLDQARRAGFDGAYLDTPLAYENVTPGRGQTRESLARAMVALITRISEYLKSKSPGMLVVPQNSPELRTIPGYLEAIDGIGMEELFFRATDKPCVESYCAEDLASARAIRAAGKFVLAVDYAKRSNSARIACDRYVQEGFAGYVTTRGLKNIASPCDAP